MISISAIIPNYNGCELLERNLPALFQELEHAQVDYEVIVVDDCSTDKSVEFLKANYPQVIIVEQEKNGGFSASCNAGIRKASKSLVFLMNSDIKLTENYFRPQFKFFENEKTFGVMGQIIGYYDNHIQDTAKWPTTKGLKVKATNNYLVEDHKESFWTPSFYLSGANALIDTEKFKILNGFDEIYSPYYCEDLDLSVRAQRLGWECYYEHESVCRHEGSVTTNKIRRKSVNIIYFRNRFIFHAIHYNNWQLKLYNLQICFNLLFRWINFRFEVYTAFWEYLKSSKEINHSRNALKELMNNHSSLSLKEIIRGQKAKTKKCKIRFV